MLSLHANIRVCSYSEFGFTRVSKLNWYVLLTLYMDVQHRGRCYIRGGVNCSVPTIRTVTDVT